MKKNNTTVKCDVDSCKHNDDKNCCLDTLNISCSCDGCDCLKKKETICDNFEKR